MAAITAALSFLFAFVVLAPPVEMDVDYTPATWSSR
jgi:hypothetical protein